MKVNEPTKGSFATLKAKASGEKKLKTDETLKLLSEFCAIDMHKNLKKSRRCKLVHWWKIPQ